MVVFTTTPAEVMHVMNPTNLPQSSKLNHWSTKAGFFIGGFASAAWAPLIPFAKLRLGLDDGGLGFILLCFGVGSLATMPVAGGLASRFGIRPVILVASVLAGVLLPILGFVNDPFLLVVALLVFGASIGTIDVVINIQAVLVEKASGRSLMSGFHAFWSIGGFVGAGLVTSMLGLGLSPVWAMAASGGLVLIIISSFQGGLLRERSPKGEKVKFQLPRGVILLVGVLAFLAFLSEGSVLDWSAVFLSSSKAVPMEWAGMGFAAFAVLMLAGRLTGDWIVGKLGPSLVLLAGGLGAVAGFAGAILLPMPFSLVGFALIGLSMANVVPVLYSVLGRQSLMPTHQAVSLVSTLAYSGVLLGPAIIGFVAQVTSLSVALGLVGASLFAIAASFRMAQK
jgi:MFS family permease